MLEKIFKLLRNIQFWTILGTIASIVSSLFLFYNPKQSDITVFAGADSRLMGTISNELNYNFNESDTLAIFYLLPILEEIDHTSYYIVDLPICITTKQNQSVKNLVISTNQTVPDFDLLNNPIIKSYSQPRDVFFDNSKKYPRLFVNNNSKNLIREFDNSTSYVDFYDYVPSHAHISIPLRLIFYTPTKIRNKIIDSFSFDLVFGEEDYNNRHMPIKVFGFLCNLREYNTNPELDYEAFYKVSSRYSTTIYVNALMERCDKINEDYWLDEKQGHLVSYINSSIGSLHVFNKEKLKPHKETFQFIKPDFSDFWTWFKILYSIFLFIFATFSWIPNLKDYYSFKKVHIKQNSQYCYKYSGTQITNVCWLYAFWIIAILSYPLIILLLLDLFFDIF